MGEGRGMEIGRRTLFRTCEITWASKRFAVQGHLERVGFILMNLYSSARPGTKGTPRKKVVSADCNEEVLISSLGVRSEEHTSELQSLRHLVCRLLLEK